tara:strand:- start:566 stop:1063 length:498 start_codon:yes stop_codon:yes gene_type:complete
MAEQGKDEAAFDKMMEDVNSEDNGGISATAKSENMEEEVDEIKDVEEDTEDRSVEASYYPHIGIMEEEGINIKELPKDIQDMIATFNRKKNMAKMKNAADSTFLQIRNLSVIISDRIIDWLEKDIDKSEEKDIEESEEKDIEESEEKDNKNEGIFDGILGGIFNW